MRHGRSGTRNESRGTRCNAPPAGPGREAGRALPGRWEKASMSLSLTSRRGIMERTPLGLTIFIARRLGSRPNDMEFSGERSESAATTG